MKLSNFARLDPALQARGIVGLQRGAKGEKEIWDDTYRRILERIQNTEMHFQQGNQPEEVDPRGRLVQIGACDDARNASAGQNE